MDPARHARIKEVFLAVQTLAPNAREAALEQACAGDAELRKDVESLLTYHESKSLLAQPPLSPNAPKRVAQINFGHGASVKWDEEQRHLLHKRIQLWALVLHLVIAVVLFRAFGVLGGVSGFVVGWVFVGLVGGSSSVVFLAVCVLLLKAPSFARLRALEMAMNIAAAIAVFSWGYAWLTQGSALPVAPSEQLKEIFHNVFWVISSDRVAYFQMPSAMLGNSLVSLSTTMGTLYALVVPNTRRRGITMVVATMMLAASTLVMAASQNPSLRPYLVKNLLFCLVVVGGYSSIALYISLSFATLRRAVFEARQVGQYQLVRLLGKGAMGEVHLAQHHLLHRPCAVKLIRSDQAISQDWLVRFEREVQAMAQLTHPNTVEIYDFGRTDDDSFFYAMEYLPGTTLDALVREHGPLPPGRVVYLMLQVCGALAEAHCKGLVHRDVKPGNIFVSERGGEHDFIKLLDFGLVHHQADMPALALERPLRDAVPNLTQVGQLIGTPSFMSPEQIRGEHLDARSDIYSLGSVAYFILTGQPPFERETLAELFEAHLKAPAPRLRDFNATMPADLELLITRCLGKERASRYQNVLEVATALSKTVAHGDWDSAQAENWWREPPVSADPEKIADTNGVDARSTAVKA